MSHDQARCVVTVIEDHGDELVIELKHGRGNTRLFVDRDQIEFKSVPPAPPPTVDHWRGF